jgi:hypothetical protein
MDWKKVMSLYKREEQMYHDVCGWLKGFLESRYKGSSIDVENTSKKVLSKWLVEKGYHRYFKDYQTYEIQVDVSGLIKKTESAQLAFVECKLSRITLRDLSQLLGYSKVAIPSFSVIVSPKGISRSMNSLFNISRRNDVLYYSSEKHIIIGRWDETRQEIDSSSIIPKGSRL